MNKQLYSKRNIQIWETILKRDFDLRNQGHSNLNKVYWNPPAELLYEQITLRHEGRISHLGAVVVRTGARYDLDGRAGAGSLSANTRTSQKIS